MLSRDVILYGYSLKLRHLVSLNIDVHISDGLTNGYAIREAEESSYFETYSYHSGGLSEIVFMLILYQLIAIAHEVLLVDRLNACYYCMERVS